MSLSWQLLIHKYCHLCCCLNGSALKKSAVSRSQMFIVENQCRSGEAHTYLLSRWNQLWARAKPRHKYICTDIFYCSATPLALCEGRRDQQAPPRIQFYHWQLPRVRLSRVWSRSCSSLSSAQATNFLSQYIWSLFAVRSQSDSILSSLPGFILRRAPVDGIWLLVAHKTRPYLYNFITYNKQRPVHCCKFIRL